MGEGDSIERVIAELRAARAKTSCGEMARLLKSLGFTVVDRKKPGHKAYFHQGLKNFRGSNYTCGHGKNPDLKTVYVTNVIRVLKKYEGELRNYKRKTS